MKVLILLLAFLAIAQPFFLQVEVLKPLQCFLTSVPSHQSLLAQIETPIISVYHRIKMTVHSPASSFALIQKDIINRLAITIPVPKSANDSTELTTCFQVQTYPEDINKTEQNKNQDEDSEESQEDDAPIPQGYLLNVKLFTSFESVLEKKRERYSENESMKDLEVAAEKLDWVHRQQVKLHQVNEKKENNIQDYLVEMKAHVIFYSMSEIIMLIAFTILQYKLLEGYLNRHTIV